MCDLSNAQVFANWQECNRGNRQQGADYWYDFMVKRAQRGGRDAEDAKLQIAKMDMLCAT